MNEKKTIELLLGLVDREYAEFKDKVKEWAEDERTGFDPEDVNKAFYLQFHRLKDALMNVITFCDIVATVERLERE